MNDKASFKRSGILNFHNRHIWSNVNPHSTIQSRHQQQFSVNGLICLRTTS
jgi:hypothetical protein